MTSLGTITDVAVGGSLAAKTASATRNEDQPMATFEAIYQNGVFKPVGTVSLPENQRVTVVVAPVATQPGRGVPAHQALGIAAGKGPPPDDDTVRRWIDERRSQRGQS